MNNLVDLINYGQSYWLDNLTRDKITGGDLKKRVKNQGLRGITTNPSIFNKAISGSAAYDIEIKKLSQSGKSIVEIYESLTINDVQDACDILKPVFEESKGIDGFVSLEVSPYLARDTEGTMREARRLHNAVNRANCYIKIPGTKEGVPAIEEMIYEGININVTLLFSLTSYAAVAKAYINAISRRIAEGKSIDNSVSVASLFISRIDVLVDGLLSHYIIPFDKTPYKNRPEALQGKVGTAMAKLTYQKFKEIFSSQEWKNLEKKGAHLQRPLWASTSNKDPLFEDVRYVNPLIGQHTVNTLPDKTIAAFAEHGILKKDSIEEDVKEARNVFKQLKSFQIDIDFVTQQLENEGIQKFINAYNKLMSVLAEKRNKMLSSKIATQKINFGKFEKDIKSTCQSLEEKATGERLYQKDPFLWKSDAESVKAISERLGWLDLPESMIKKTDAINSFVDEVKSEDYQYAVLLGMGGSSLCSEVSRETFKVRKGYLELLVLDNVAPEAVLEIEQQIDIQKTIFIVASKSGTTTETLSFLNYFFEKLVKTNFENPGKNFIAITDPKTSLIRTAEGHGFRKIFLNNPNLGGRYSVLSDFGIIPMALMGIDIKTILEHGAKMKLDCGPAIPVLDNPGLLLGATLGVCEKKGCNKITFIMSPSIRAFGYWVEQLLAESTGKEGNGLVPINGEQLGKPDVYEKDRLFIHISLKEEQDKKIEQKLKLLENEGHPVVSIEVNDKLALGGEYYRWEVAVAIAGMVIGINAFNQPNVEESKQNTREILSEWKKRGSFSKQKPVITSENITVYSGENNKALKSSKNDSLSTYLSAFTHQAQTGDYIAFLPYFLMTGKRKELLQTWRMNLRNHLKVATTLLAGPRYLHSTGQLHKGGSNSGLFIIFTSDEPEQLPIPTTKYDFATLDFAEALGDFKALNNKKRRLIRIHLGNEYDIENSLKRILSELGL